jgi:hypothetical protein
MERVENLELADGSIYTGECINLFGTIQMEGKGKLIYPNGEKYIGEFKNGLICGYGTYLYLNKNSHCGHFHLDCIPEGLGYTNVYSKELNAYPKMYMGVFTNGKLNGWGITIGEGKSAFGWWKNNILIRDYSEYVDWAWDIIIGHNHDSKLLRQYKNGLLGIGIPEIKTDFLSVPFFGFLFYKNGDVLVGKAKSQKKEYFGMLLKSDSEIEYANYENDKIVRLSDYREVSLMNIGSF